MRCDHAHPRIVSKVYCTVCECFYGETEITVEVIALALWRMKRDGRLDVDSDDLRECVVEVGQLMEIANEIATERRDG